MPFINDLPEAAKSTLAEQLSRGFPGGKGSISTSLATVAVTASFQVWSLSADAVRSGSDDLAELAVDTGQWHHQISRDGRPALYARSTSAADPKAWALSKVFESPLAAKFDEAIRWIDANERRDLLVHVLEAPSYHLHGFWLVGRSGESFVLVVEAARRRLAGLATLELLPSAQFLERLRAVEPIKGVVLGSGRS